MVPLRVFVFFLFFCSFMTAAPFPWLTNFYSEPVKFIGTTGAAYSHPLVFANGRILFVWVERGTAGVENIFCSLSEDGGATWLPKQLIASKIMSPSSEVLHLTAACSPAGNVVVAVTPISAQQPKTISVFTSFGSFEQWTQTQFDTELKGYLPQLSVTRSGKFWLTYLTSNKAIAALRSNDGTSWSGMQIISPESQLQGVSTITNIDNNSFIAAYLKVIPGHQVAQIVARRSYDNGTTWSDEYTLYQDTALKSGARILQSLDGRLHLIFKSQRKTLRGVIQNDIVHSYSDDLGTTWNSYFLTNNYRDDFNPSSSQLVLNNPLVSFASVREENSAASAFYLSIAGITPDNKPTMSYSDQVAGQKNFYTGVATIRVDDIYQIDRVTLEYRIGSGPAQEVQMFDDGLHSDGTAGDFRYGAYFPLPQTADSVFCRFKVKGASDYVLTSGYTKFFFNNIIPDDIALLDENKVKIPFMKNGSIADYSLLNGIYNNETFLYSSGFYLSGYAPGSTLFGNGMFSAGRTYDYLPGLINSDPNAEINKVYSVNAGDAPFSASWLTWADAVSQGAPYYDGNGNGIYDPVDFNGNGSWDPNEDKPVIAGNRILWTVFNDGVVDTIRNFREQPRQIEIKQTAFAFRNPEYSLEHAVFLKYTITNKSSVPYDSILFSFAADPDIGNYVDDHAGVSVPDKMSYAYNAATDARYGQLAPAYGMALLQGPVRYIPGVTFTDVNSNGIFDEGDIPLANALVKSNDFKSNVSVAGAQLADMVSSTVNFKSHPVYGDPNTALQLRNRQLGKTTAGAPIDPCILGNGSTLTNCNELDPRFVFSGDPETQNGWLQNFGIDIRIYTTTGPFALQPGQSQDIIGAYIVTEGNSPLNAVTKLKERSAEIRTAFDYNFPVLVGVKEETQAPGAFVLHDNFPNPFNPETQIRVDIPRSENISLRIYDILGNEIAVLANGYYTKGTHAFRFTASGLSSGVYIMRLHSESGIHLTKKMTLLK